MSNANNTFERNGTVYTQCGPPIYLVKVQGPGTMAEMTTVTRSEVGALVARITKHARQRSVLTVCDMNAIANDGSCRRLNFSTYSNRSGEWRKVGGGPRILALEA